MLHDGSLLAWIGLSRTGPERIKDVNVDSRWEQLLPGADWFIGIDETNNEAEHPKLLSSEFI